MEKNSNLPNHWIEVARLGRSVGINGSMRCQVLSDFPEVFQNGRVFFIFSSLEKSQTPLTIKHFAPTKSIIQFTEITTPESAKNLTNKILYCTLEDTKKFCHLKQGEFFWFDIIGCKVLESDRTLGVVKDIQRIASTDYLLIQTEENLTKKHPKEFLLPYLKNFILDTNLSAKTIIVQNAKAILEAS